MCRRNCPPPRRSENSSTSPTQELLTWLRETLNGGRLQSSGAEDIKRTTEALLGQSREKVTSTVDLGALRQAGASDEELEQITALLTTSTGQPS